MARIRFESLVTNDTGLSQIELPKHSSPIPPRDRNHPQIGVRKNRDFGPHVRGTGVETQRFGCSRCDGSIDSGRHGWCFRAKASN